MRPRFNIRLVHARPHDYPWPRRWYGTPWYWALQLLGWGVVGTLFLLSGLSVQRPNLLAIPAAMFLGGLASTHLLRVAILWLRSRARSWCAFGAELCLWIGLAGAALTGITHGTAALFAPELLARSQLPPLASFLVPLVETSVLLTGWAGLYLGIVFFRGHQRAEQARQLLEEAVRDAELRVLRAQINPHFLFNSLNTLRLLILDDPRLARDAVGHLAELLRALLSADQRRLVPFEEELDLVRNYLALEQLRFEERLRVRWAIPEDSLRLPVPPTVLHTVVENALKHGVAAHPAGGEIALRAHCTADTLEITVTNTGKLGATAATPSTGVGLKNARGRLHHLYGDRADLRLVQQGENQVVATLRIPREADPPPAEPAAPPAEPAGSDRLPLAS